MTSSTIKVGIIGTGGIAKYQHIPSYQKMPGYEIAAACDANQDSLEQAQEQFGIPQGYADYRDLLTNEKLDLVSICTSNDMHYHIAMAAIENGLDVYCEKPLAMNLAEARAMYEAATAKGLVTGVNFSHRRTPAARLAKEILDSGALGDLYYVAAVYAAGRPDYAELPGTWRNQRDKAGFGGLGDMGAHIIDMMRWWLQSEITEVTAQLKTFVPQRVSLYTGEPMRVTTEDQGTILVGWSNGAQGYFCGGYTFTGRGYDQRVEVYGTRGGLMYDQHRPHELDVFIAPEYLDSYTVLRHGGTPEKPYTTILVPEHHRGKLSGDGKWRRTVLMDFLDAYRKREAFQPSFWEGLKVQEILEAARIADEERRWVQLPL